jgi:2-C-methyl-D-erythritol 4-phosphate cytidylyltransferase
VPPAKPEAPGRSSSRPAPARGWAAIVPKAFAGLLGRPLLAESLERLDASDWVDAIVVAAPVGWEEPAILLAEELVASKVAAVVTGGATRAESVRIALAEVPEDALVVLVHDAARPLVDDAVIERLLARLAEGVDGVVRAFAIGDTVKRLDRGMVAETIDREALVASRLRRCSSPTGCARPTRASSQAPPTAPRSSSGQVAGSRSSRETPRLVKVTTADDLELVARLVEDDGS